MNALAQGYYHWLVLDENDQVKQYSPKAKPNLILNNGLNLVANTTWADCFTNCFVGSGASAPTTGDVSLESFITGHDVYFEDVDSNGSLLGPSSVTLKRTFSFFNPSDTYSISELGFSPNNEDNLFSRISIGSGIDVGQNETFLVQYNLIINFLPSSPQRLTSPIDGAATNGVLQFQLDGISDVNADGTTSTNDLANLCNEPSRSGAFFLSQNGDLPATFGNAIDRSNENFEILTGVNSSYIEDSFYIDKIANFRSGQFNNTWNSIGIGALDNSPEKNTGLVYVSDSSFSKTGFLNLTFRYSWDRVTEDEFKLLFYLLDEEQKILFNQNPLLTYFDSNQ